MGEIYDFAEDKNDTVGRAKNKKYLTIIFTSEYKKNDVYGNIKKNINKNYVKIKFESSDNVPLSILANIHTLVLVVRYQRVYLNTCWYEQVYEKVQVYDTVY